MNKTLRDFVVLKVGYDKATVMEEPYYNTDVIPIQQQRAMVFKNFKRAIVIFTVSELSPYGLFTVSAGPHSNYSYSGSFYPNEVKDLHEMEELLLHKNKEGKLFK